MDRRGFFRLTGFVGGGLLLAACGDDGDSGGSGSGGGGGGGGGTIGISLNGNNAYSSYVAEGVLAALDGTEYDFTGIQNNFDSSQELGNIENLINQGIVGLVVLPADAGTLARAAEIAQQQDIPVGNALWPGESDADEFFSGVAALDSVEGGRLIGEWLKANATPGPVIVVQGIVGQGFSERIDEGLDESLQGSGFEVVVREQGFFDRDQATDIVESGLQANPGVTAIVAYSASMSNGIASYLESQGIESITHVSSDADDEMFEWLGTPYLAASRYYSAGETGYVVAQAVLAAIAGDDVTFENEIFQDIITAENKDAMLADHPYRYEDFADQAATI
jgi:ribose transport system substrate-binding protein